MCRAGQPPYLPEQRNDKSRSHTSSSTATSRSVTRTGVAVARLSRTLDPAAHRMVMRSALNRGFATIVYTGWDRCQAPTTGAGCHAFAIPRTSLVLDRPNVKMSHAIKGNPLLYRRLAIRFHEASRPSGRTAVFSTQNWEGTGKGRVGGGHSLPVRLGREMPPARKLAPTEGDKGLRRR